MTGGGPVARVPRRRRALAAARAARVTAGGRVPAAREGDGTGGGGGLARAAGVTAGLTAAGAVLGLARDQLMAHMFGAGAQTDAFLVAWTVPEVAATVLIEDAMALLMVPAFSAVLARGAGGARGLVRGTLPRLVALLGALTALLAAGAPYVVGALAPGVADPRAAVDCTRLTATTVFAFGLAGYLSAALRAHHRFVPPAAIYLAYNTGIVATLLALHAGHGVRAAAAGVAVGGVCMVAVQLPAFAAALRSPGLPAPAGRRDAAAKATGPAYALVVPVVVFTVARQAQVLLERHFAAPLPAGAISHLNYAQKIAQLPMALSLMLCTVTFPSVSRALAEGDRERARRRVERDLTLACLMVLVGAAYVIGCAPAIVHALFQRGEFGAADTTATAAVMRVYALGLLGQCLVGAVVRPYFSAAGPVPADAGVRPAAGARGARCVPPPLPAAGPGTPRGSAEGGHGGRRGRRDAGGTGRTRSGPTWYPAASMGGGLLVTAVVDAVAAGPLGACGIAAGNAAGITVTAVLLLRGLGAHTIAVRPRALAARLARTAPAAAAATAAGWALTAVLPGAWTATALGALAVPAVFAATARMLRPRPGPDGGAVGGAASEGKPAVAAAAAADGRHPSAPGTPGVRVGGDVRSVDGR